MNRKNILETKGKISMEQAKKKARREYKSYKAFLQEQEYIESLKELDKDLKKRINKNTPK